MNNNQSIFHRLLMLVVVVGAFIPQSVVAQTIKGKVTDAITGEALIGAAVMQHETPYAERYDFGTGQLRIDKSSISLPNVFYRIDF